MFDAAVTLCRRAGFKDILLRGDTDFSLISHFDRWDDDGVRFVFGYDAYANLVKTAQMIPDDEYRELVRNAEHVLKTEPRAKPPRIKEQIVKEKRYKNIKLDSEDMAEFEYRPKYERRCKRSCRVVVLRKNLTVERGEEALFDDVRYFFYITNDWKLSMEEVVRESNQRCNQENLIEQLKNGVRALHAPVNTLNANWAYMVIASLAWTIKAWVGLSLPVSSRWKELHETDRNAITRMDFRTFLSALVNVPAQIARTGRRILYRLLAWTRWQHVFFRFLEAT